MRTAKMYTVPAHLYRFHAPSRCYDVFVGGRFLGREMDYFSCDEMADDYRFAQQTERELAAAQLAGDLIDAQQAAAVTALQTLGATQAQALRVLDADALERAA
jgi:hypothetical protein